MHRPWSAVQGCALTGKIGVRPQYPPKLQRRERTANKGCVSLQRVAPFPDPKSCGGCWRVATVIFPAFVSDPCDLLLGPVLDSKLCNSFQGFSRPACTCRLPCLRCQHLPPPSKHSIQELWLIRIPSCNGSQGYNLF